MTDVKAARLCSLCGAPIPNSRRKDTLFCGPLCKRKAQWERDKANPKPRRNPPCIADGCQTSRLAKGFCQKHYNRLRSKGSLGDERKNAKGQCSAPGCTGPHLASGLCEKHYRRKRAAEQRVTREAEMTEKSCLQCGGSLQGRRSNAIFCSRACKSVERVTTGAAARASERHYFASRYGLTRKQVEEMAAGGCSICGTKKWPGRHARPHVDHCHETGRVRGVLCSECNTGLGKFKDDPRLLRRAVEYLAT